jgi:NAD(P)-dependent dehydrogenase (short-subunit alcohol dehydrogenase family)
MNSFRFESGVAVVTGAASGIGLELTRLALKHSMRLVLADIDFKALQGVAETLQIPKDQMLLLEVDVSQEKQVKDLAEQSFKRFGHVDLLCNNAGVALNKPVWEHTHLDWEWVMSVNLFSLAHAIRYFVPPMIAQQHPSHLLNTASVAGFLNTSGLAAYNASKHGVVSLSETLYHELKDINSPLGVSVLCPAWVNTNINASALKRPDYFGALEEAPSVEAEKYRAQMTKALQAAKLSAADVAQFALSGVNDGVFYLVPHHKINTAIEQRMQGILSRTNP